MQLLLRPKLAPPSQTRCATYHDDAHDDDYDDADDSVLTNTGSGGRWFRSLAEGCLPSRTVSGGRPFRSLAEGCIT